MVVRVNFKFVPTHHFKHLDRKDVMCTIHQKCNSMPILETHALRKEYGQLVAVNDVSFNVERGQVVGLIGPNGAGKTTLLRLLATVLRPTSGTALIQGEDLSRDFLNIRKRVGYLPDFFNLYSDLTLRECIQFFAAAYGVERRQIPQRVTSVLEYVELMHKADDFIRNLSRGMVQRLGLAAKLVHEPDLFLLDEPASGLDPKARIQLRDILKRLSSEGRTIIISSHILTELSGFCSHIALMNNGRLSLYGEVDEIERAANKGIHLEVEVLNKLDVARQILEGEPDSRILSVEGNMITVSLGADDQDIARINGALVGAGVEVSGLAKKKTDLEDLFMKLANAEGGVPQ